MTNNSLTKRVSGWQDLATLQEEMNRLFESTLGPASRGAGLLGSDFVPPVDVLRNHDLVIVRADLPGMKKEDIDLSVVNNRLFIRGEKKHENESGEANSHRLERFYGSIERVIELPADVDSEKVTADFRDGVLEVKAPVREEAKPRQITVGVN